jgi:hypothetical protein
MSASYIPIVLVSALCLTGCDEHVSKTQRTAQCAMEGLNVFSSDPDGAAGRRSYHVHLCMTAAGYEYVRNQAECSTMTDDAACYRSTDDFTQFVAWKRRNEEKEHAAR